MSDVKHKLPLKGRIDIEVITPNDFVLTVIRDDGKELSIHMTRGDVKNLAEYMLHLLEIFKEGGDSW